MCNKNLNKKIFLMAIFLLLIGAACSDNSLEGDKTIMSNVKTEDLNSIKNMRIYFGHQSVGYNIVAGIEDLIKDKIIPEINLVRLEDSAEFPEYYFAHSSIGKNGYPNVKCDDFSDKINFMNSNNIGYALLKFCYVDIRRETNVDEMFEYYSKTMDSLISKYPQIKFILVTVPLTERGPWFKRFIKGIMGENEYQDIANKKRCEFNDMLISRYKDNPVFDLAKIESTRPDGTRTEYEIDGKTYYYLFDGYTMDGGHLNEAGRKKVAYELILTLAKLES